MRNIWILVLVFLLAGCSETGSNVAGSSHPAPYTVSGTVQDNVTGGTNHICHVVIDTDTNKGNGFVTENVFILNTTHGFSIAGLPAGNFYLYVFKDNNADSAYSTLDSTSPDYSLMLNNDVVLNPQLNTIQP